MEITIERLDNMVEWIDSISVVKLSMKEKIRLIEEAARRLERCKMDQKGEEHGRITERSLDRQCQAMGDTGRIEGRGRYPRFLCPKNGNGLRGIGCL